ncbi:hypothetical protein NMG60_11018806 [Bertholletia excelsa]
MAQMAESEYQIELKCSAEKFFETYTSKGYLLPQICHALVSGVDVVRGDWGTVGSIRTWHYVPGNSEIGKVRIEAFDEQNKSVTFVLLEGEMTDQYPIF